MLYFFFFFFALFFSLYIVSFYSSFLIVLLLVVLSLSLCPPLFLFSPPFPLFFSLEKKGLFYHWSLPVSSRLPLPFCHLVLLYTLSPCLHDKEFFYIVLFKHNPIFQKTRKRKKKRNLVMFFNDHLAMIMTPYPTMQ